MPAPTDRNDRIALAKEWKWVEFPSLIAPYHSVDGLTSFRSSVPTHWYNPEAEPAMRPDFVGTLEGVSGMLRELNEHAKAHGQHWVWSYDDDAWPNHDYDRCYYCAKQGLSIHKSQPLPVFLSPDDRPGNCVGDAYLSAFGKEAA